MQTLRRCVELEARLIDDLLDLTRIVRGKLALHLEVVDVHCLVQAVARYVSLRSGRQMPINFRSSIRRQSHFASADPGRLQQVFWNILKNATKFTPRRRQDSNPIRTTPPTTVCRSIHRFRRRHDRTKQSTRIFKPFEQGSSEIVRRYGGLGLGLASAKHSSKPRTEPSRPPAPAREGSTFTHFVPTVPAAQQASRNRVKPQHHPKNADGNRSLEILLVEDHDDTSRVLSRLFERLGHRVRIADSVAAALVAAKQPFDLLLSDLGLPDGSGIDLIQPLRQTNHPNGPAVALTGFGMEEDIAKSREAGFTEHLTKPINFQRLQMVIQQIAEQQ